MSHNTHLALTLAVQAALFGATMAAYLGVGTGRRYVFTRVDAGAMCVFGVLLTSFGAAIPPAPQVGLGGAIAVGFLLGAGLTTAGVTALAGRSEVGGQSTEASPTSVVFDPSPDGDDDE